MADHTSASCNNPEPAKSITPQTFTFIRTLENLRSDQNVTGFGDSNHDGDKAEQWSTGPLFKSNDFHGPIWNPRILGGGNNEQ